MIANASIFKDAWNVLYNVVSGAVADPATRGGSAWIFSSFPAIQEGKNDEFPGYPIITLESFQPDTELLTHGAGYMSCPLNTEISLFSKSKAQLDAVACDIFDAISSNRSVFVGSGFRLETITPMGIDTDVISRNNKIHAWTVGIGFKFNMI